ncbi:MAG: right-handed parallel beta-helix repeat-containing protein [Candidatus Heimdallarchaeaceae archaeon]
MKKRTFCYKRRILAIGLVIVTIMVCLIGGKGSLIIETQASGTGDYPPPVSGTWTITQETIVEKEKIYLNGSVEIQDQGRLILKNCHILMNAQSNGEGKFSVLSGGNLNIYNSTIEAYSNYVWFIISYGNIKIEESELIGYKDESSNTALINLFYNSEIIKDNVIRNSGGSIISIASSSNTIISGNTIDNAGGNGISLTSSSFNNTISGNTINNTGRYGIGLVEQSSYNFLTANIITNTGWDGISIVGSSFNNTVSGNTINNAGEDGIYLSSSFNNTISGNTIDDASGGGIGICFSSNNNAIIENTISGSNYDGIYISSSNSLVFSNNFIKNKRWGVCLDYNSNNTFIHHNIFILNNIDSSSQAYDDGENNIWYNNETREGNYWSDSDGLSKYNISGSVGSIDYYPMISDYDNDSISDYYEISNGLDPLTDDASKDLDGDGLTNLEEYNNNTEANNSDTDSDLMPDGWEVANGLDPLTDDASKDLDGDGLTNLEEYDNNTEANNNDTDDDGLLDGEEINTYSTDPNNDDTDEDGLTDGEEITIGTFANNSDTDEDGMPDGWEVNSSLDPLRNDADEDPDNDGLTNLEEYQHLTDPHNVDTDEDGMPDGWEVENNLNPLKNDADEDPDNDGLTNLEEYQYLTDPHDSDTDEDGMPDGWEIEHEKNPLKNNIYFEPVEIIGYFVIIPTVVIIIIFLLYRNNIQKKTEKTREELQKLIHRQTELNDQYEEVFANISSLLKLISSVDKIKNYLEKQKVLLATLLFIRSNVKRLTINEKEQFNKEYEETISFICTTLHDGMVSLIDLINLTNLQDYTKEVSTNLIHNWSKKEFKPLIVSYEEILSFLNYIIVFRDETLTPLNALVHPSEPLWSKVYDLATERLVIVQEILEQNSEIFSELTTIVSDSETNNKRLERLEKISSVYNKISLTKLSPLLDFDNIEVMKLWLQAYSADIPNQIEGNEVIFNFQVEGALVTEDMTTAIDDLLKQFSDWERTGKGKKK